MRIELLMLGKTRRAEIRALLDDYAGRLRRFAEIELHELREDSPAALRKLEIPAGATVVLLDAAGKNLDSDKFAAWLGGCRDGGMRELVFLCGAAEGASRKRWRKASDAENFPLRDDVFTRTGARDASRADLPRIHNSVRPSLCEVARVGVKDCDGLDVLCGGLQSGRAQTRFMPWAPGQSPDSFMPWAPSRAPDSFMPWAPEPTPVRSHRFEDHVHSH